MERGTRVRLKQDFTDESGQYFKAGQVGTAGGSYAGRVVVDFDGYEDARKQDAEQRSRTGEGFNVVPWAVAVPAELLDVA